MSPRGKSIATLLPLRRGAVDVRTTRERQAEQPGDLVEGLAGRVVDGGAERVHPDGHVLDLEQAGVAAGDEHRQARLGQRPVLELVDRDVGGEVVDAVQRLAEAEGERLGRWRRRPAARRRARARWSPRWRRRRAARCRRSRRPARWWAPSPRGARGWRPRARRRRTGRAPRRCRRPRRRAGCARARCRRRSRRRRSRCRARGVRHSWRHSPSTRPRPDERAVHHERVRPVAVVARPHGRSRRTRAAA